MTVNCVGVAVSVKIDPIVGLVTRKMKNKTFVGVPFQGAFPFDVIKNILIDKGLVEDSNILGNFMFLNEVTL